MPYYVANQKVRCSIEQSLCLEILLLPAKYKDSRILIAHYYVLASGKGFALISAKYLQLRAQFCCKLLITFGWQNYVKKLKHFQMWKIILRCFFLILCTVKKVEYVVLPNGTYLNFTVGAKYLNWKFGLGPTSIVFQVNCA